MTLFFLLMGVVFSINLQSQEKIEEQEFIPLGLLVNDHTEQQAGFAARLAVNKINDKGGINGKPLKLITRSVEGFWGAGSGEVVDLVFNEKVMAILGSIDGRNSHLAEQVIAKTQVLYISTWASDPSLSKAYVPWYFSIVPTDDQQATLLLDEVYVKKGFQKILIVHDNTYDVKQALKSFVEGSKGIETMNIQSFGYPATASESTDFLAEVKSSDAEAIMLMGMQLPLLRILKELEAMKETIPVYANLSVQGSQEFFSSQSKYKDQFKVTGSEHNLHSDYTGFESEFTKQYNKKPGVIAVFAYDGIMIIAEALKQSENHGISLQQTMSQINYQGLSAKVQFDSQGRIKNAGELLILRE